MDVRISMIQRAIFIEKKRIETTPLEFALFVTFYRRRSAITRKKIERGELRKTLHAVFAKIGLTDMLIPPPSQMGLEAEGDVHFQVDNLPVIVYYFVTVANPHHDKC